MKDGNWSEIIDHYKKARDCFWCPEGVQNWHGDDENGYYHLWIAYHMAQESEKKDHLWYARILYMMTDEMRCKFDVFTVFRRYAEPMMKEFTLAEQAGTPPTDKELSIARNMHYWMAYDVECHSYETNDVEHSIGLIENNELLEHFNFHDSLPVFFTHDGHTAVLKLQYNELVATLEFINISDIYVDGDPTCSYILEFFCYPARKGDDREVVFDIEYYRITCEHIKVLSVEKVDETV